MLYVFLLHVVPLCTHLRFEAWENGRNSQTTMSYSLPWMQMFIFEIMFYWNIFYWFVYISDGLGHMPVCTVYPKKYAHGFCFAVLCCGYTLTDFPISIRLTSLALWQSNDCPSASKATLMNMDKYFMWIHYDRLHNHNKAKHNKTVCIFLGIYCITVKALRQTGNKPQPVPTLAIFLEWKSNYIHYKMWGELINHSRSSTAQPSKFRDE